MALRNKTFFHQCCSTARRCPPSWSSHSHEDSTSRPRRNHQDFIARIHLGKFTRKRASIKTRFRHCLRALCCCQVSKLSRRCRKQQSITQISFQTWHHQSACVQNNSGKASPKHLRFIHWVEVINSIQTPLGLSSSVSFSNFIQFLLTSQISSPRKGIGDVSVLTSWALSPRSLALPACVNWRLVR